MTCKTGACIFLYGFHCSSQPQSSTRQASHIAKELMEVMGLGQGSSFLIDWAPLKQGITENGYLTLLSTFQSPLLELPIEMKSFPQVVASQCFSTGLMLQRLLLLQLGDHLPPPYRVLSPIYPRLPIHSNESRGTNGWVNHIVPPPSVGYWVCRPWSLQERSESWV